jgi:hypothetical protein
VARQPTHHRPGLPYGGSIATGLGHVGTGPTDPLAPACRQATAPTPHESRRDSALPQNRFGGKARYTGMDVAFAVVHVATVCNGNVTRLDMFWDRADALEAVRPPE